MTDDLEHELRTLLAAKAKAVSPNVATGEQTIADRLRAGDHALADVVPMAPRRHRGRWLLAAAAVVAVIAGALVLRDDDAGVETGPVASSSTTGDPTPPATTDPLSARDGESAKDLAERVALQVFGDEYVTTGVENGDDRLLGGQSKVVTMAGSGDTLLAYVSGASPDGPLRVNVLTNPALDGHLTTNTTDGALTAVDLPADGSLAMWGYDRSLERTGQLPATPVADHRAEVIAPWWASASFVAYELTTSDGQVLRALLPVAAG